MKSKHPWEGSWPFPWGMSSPGRLLPHTLQITFWGFYSRSRLTDTTFPAVGFALLLNYKQISGPRAKPPLGLPNTLHARHRDMPLPSRERFIRVDAELPQKHHFPTKKSRGKMLLRQRKTSPARKTTLTSAGCVKNQHRAAASSCIRSCCDG